MNPQRSNETAQTLPCFPRVELAHLESLDLLRVARKALWLLAARTLAAPVRWWLRVRAQAAQARLDERLDDHLLRDIGYKPENKKKGNTHWYWMHY
jgi:hypothetical protein